MIQEVKGIVSDVINFKKSKLTKHPVVNAKLQGVFEKEINYSKNHRN